MRKVIGISPPLLIVNPAKVDVAPRQQNGHAPSGTAKFL
jgi:hypothetical protein